MTVVRNQLRDFLVAGALAILIASAAFVGVRNKELAARQLDLATRSAEAIANARDALPTVHAAIISEPRVSTKHPYLRRRLIRDGGKPRVLGADRSHADDKLFYDAANRFQRDGAFAELIPDGTGRAIVARKAKDGVAIAVTAPAAPESYPFLVIIGVLGLGASIAAAGALVGRRAQRLGTFAGIGTLAVPALLWQSWAAAFAILAIAGAVALAQGAGLTDRIMSNAAATIAEGEVMQLAAAKNTSTTEDDYLAIINAKTAALFSAAAESGAALTQRPPEEQSALRSYGKNLGLAFQLVDDALDYAGDSSRLGKSVGDDFREGKITLPVILSFRRGTSDERQFWNRTIADGDIADGDLEQAVALMRKHKAIEATFERARSYGAIARDALAIFPDSREKDALEQVIAFCIGRSH